MATRTHLSVTPEGRGATFTANVADMAGNPAHDGVVSFDTAKGSVGSALVANGSATLKVDKLPQGTRSVTAVYHGGERLVGSAASASANPDQSTLPDFALTATPTSFNLTSGQIANVTITITPENGFNDMVTLSCANVPYGAACVFSPTALAPVTSSPVTSTLQIQTQGPSGTSAMLSRSPSALALAIGLPGLFALVGLGTLHKRSGIGRVAAVVAILTIGWGLAGCGARYGYRHYPPSGNPGIAAGTYTIVVSGYATLSGTSVVGHSLNVTLNVK